MVLGISWGDVESFATVIGVLAGGVGLLITAYQSYLARSIAQGDFLLRLDDAMQRHDHVHARLRDGTWLEQGCEPTQEEGYELKPYLGLFERVDVLLEARVVDIEDVDRLFGYRLDYVLWNEHVHERARKNPQGWGHYLSLQQKIDKLHCRGMGRGRRSTSVDGVTTFPCPKRNKAQSLLHLVARRRRSPRIG